MRLREDSRMVGEEKSRMREAGQRAAGRVDLWPGQFFSLLQRPQAKFSWPKPVLSHGMQADSKL